MTNLARHTLCGWLALLSATTSALGAPPAAGAPGAPPVTTPNAPPGATPPTPESEANAAFRLGEELWQRGRHAEALQQFERAYEILPAYEVLYFIGAVSVELKRWAQARRAFELYLQLGADRIEQEQLLAVRQHLDALNGLTATLSLTLNVPDAEVHVDGNKLESTTISGLVVDPGEHTVRVSKRGFRPVEQIVKASDGENVHLVVPLAPLALDAVRAPEEPMVGLPPARAALPSQPAAEPGTGLWLPWTITGVLAAGWATTAVLAVQAREDRDTLERPGVSADRIAAARRVHIALAVVSDVLLVSTLASGGVSAYLTWWQPEAAPSAGRPAAAQPAGGWALHVAGHF